jgi:hypothetical protein
VLARTGSVGSIHPVAPLTFVSQAGSLVTRRVLVADATFKRPIDFWGLLDGHKLPTPEGSTYAGVDSRESVRIALTYAALNGIMCCGCQECSPASAFLL